MRRAGAAALLALLSALPAASAPAAAQTVAGEAAPDAARGRTIFHRGVTAEGGEIQAAMGPEAFEVSASLVPCASCHGHDGRGRPEGGIAPSDLTWTSLTDPRGARRPDRRHHPPYDERSLLRAVTMGVDPAGNELNDTMPRYRLSRRDAADLIAYMKVLGREADPGVTADFLRIGTLLRPGSPRGDAARRALSIYFDDLNRRGGIYGRRVELEVLTLPEEGAGKGSIGEAVRRAWGEAPPFALVAPDLTGHERPLAELFEETSMPAVGPVAPDPWLELPPNRYVFYLYGGVDELGRTLIDFAAGRDELKGGRLLILHAGDAEGLAWAASARSQARLETWEEVRETTIAEHQGKQEGGARASREASALSSRAGEADVVLFLGGDRDLGEFLASADAGGWHPAVLVPGLLAAPALLGAPEAFRGRLYAAFPTLLTDADPAVASGYWQLAQEQGLGSEHLASQLAAVSAATLLAEGLYRSGRDLSREKLIEALEGLYDFNTGLTPEMAFSPNRRLGARGAHVVAVDLEKGSFEPTGKRIVPR